MFALFYALVALIALVGQATGATEWLHAPLAAAVIAAAALEFGGVVLSRHALQRMKLGETALAARLASAAVATFATAFNWLSHSDPRAGAFFAGMSALGYVVWLLDSGARRRDQLRKDDKLNEAAPIYGLWRWLTHPLITREARALAIETPALGLHGSLNAAARARRTARQRVSIAKVLHRKIRAAVDPTTADIATAVYDMDEVATRLASGADYDGLTALIAADLAPHRLANPIVVDAHVVSAVTDMVADMAELAELAESFTSTPPAVDVVDVDVVDAPVKTPRPPRMLSNRPTSSGPSIEWDVDRVVDMILRKSTTAQILDEVDNIGTKGVQRVRSVIRGLDEGKADADMVKPSNITASMVARIRTSYEKAKASQ